MAFTSEYKRIGWARLPEYSGTRVMMLPVVIGDIDSLPSFVAQYRGAFACLSFSSPENHEGKVGYLTIDEKGVLPGATHRRAGLHVDGIYRGEPRGGWSGGGGWAGGKSGSNATGMLTVSSHAGCRIWAQEFEGWPGDEGGCEHLRGELKSEGTVIGPGEVYWMGGLCVHESIPQPEAVKRQFVRLSLPSDCPWFEGYTENPLGVKPTGEILPRRVFMDAA